VTTVPPTPNGTNPPISGAQLAHLGILVFDIHTMTSFYETVFGLRVTDRGRAPDGRETAFISPRSAFGVLIQFWEHPKMAAEPLA